ncbi:transposase [Pyrococcus furiosus DSM 3638]|uniref:Transposase n=2 Tax=Pyrococcus furiosus TaxID=2261 RepID=Q8U452_PYRFU|nr:transposase [Pyrococcus furiosus DSM 3638]AFN03028.1 transposase [Pyrococcus furiosus COM1]MDK2870539.1 hypothetical protein [Pyrococcus sp.]
MGLYLKGPSYKQVARILGMSHYRMKMLAMKKREVDDTVTKINGERRYLWAAIDVESREILAI